MPGSDDDKRFNTILNGYSVGVADMATKDYIDQVVSGTDRMKELDLRKNNPAVKEAWERYQIVLKLAMT